MSTDSPTKAGYLAPDLVAKLANMEISARLVVEGFLIGLHRSPYHGFSVEFAEYRQYNPGDPIRHIDWKVFGRTDRFYVKEFEEETNLRCYILLDKSASMGFGSGKLTKLQYASYLAAALSYLLIKQKDATGLITFDSEEDVFLPPRSTRIGLFEILKHLEKTVPGGETAISSIFKRLAEQVHRRGMVIVISDLLDDPDEVIRAIKMFRHRKHEVLVFHILDPKELEFDFSQEAIFEDMETGKRLPIQPWVLKRDYIGSVRDYTKRLRYAFENAQVDYTVLSTQTAYDVALLSYLHRRARMG